MSRQSFAQFCEDVERKRTKKKTYTFTDLRLAYSEGFSAETFAAMNDAIAEDEESYLCK